MAKLRLYDWLLFLIMGIGSLMSLDASAQYKLRVNPVDKDTNIIQQLKLQTNFRNRELLDKYIDGLPAFLQGKGYASASIDSFKVDSNQAVISLFFGEIFEWATLTPTNIDKRILDAIGWEGQDKKNRKPLTLLQYQKLQEKMLDNLEGRGYPFAKIYIDSIEISDDNKLEGLLKLDLGPLYKIDSIRVYGTTRISNQFLQQYLELPNGSIYQREKLARISSRLRELPYLQEQQPWNLTMLGTGSVLNLYLQPKKSSQVNVLVGFLPSNQESGKLLVTGEANINLRNALGNGEQIEINWQQFLPKSPRLHLGFQQPYLFKSPFGLNTSFDLYKKDSSYVNLNLLLGIQYTASSTQAASVFIQNQRTNVLIIDTQQVLVTKELPDIADVNSVNVGFIYNLNKTDYRFNPRRGNELSLNLSAGRRKIKRSEAIEKLSDPNDPTFQYESLYDSIEANTYQFRIKLDAAHYFKLGRTSTIRTAIQSGLFQSPDIFRNELFQIGGYKILRGFDEESIFSSAYLVFTAEYRYLVGQNSYLFSFVDLGWSNNEQAEVKNNFLGAGLGLAFETKAGVFNISYAVGKRDDVKFDLRQSKIHLGFVTFF